MAEIIPIRDGGTIYYDAAFFDKGAADALFDRLRRETPWKQEVGRGRPFPRLTAWYADPGLSYSYSGVTHHGIEWTPALREVKRRVEEASGAAFNSLLLNLYRDGKDSIGFHTDAEPELGENPVVASVSITTGLKPSISRSCSCQPPTISLSREPRRWRRP